jgi:hypothetical protein
MVELPKLGIVPPDPFNPEALRLDQSFLAGGQVKKMLTTVPVRRPNPQDFVRVHPGEDYRLTVALIVLRDDRESYLVDPRLAAELSGEWAPYTIYTAITRQGVVHLWPVRLPSEDGRQNEWWRSAGEAAELAMRRWIRMKANSNLGAYEIFEAAGAIPDPDWPATSLKELLGTAFRDRLVDSTDHAVLQRLRGAS